MNYVRDIHVKLKLHRVCIYKRYSCLACAAAKTAEPRTSSHRERTMHILPGDRLPCTYPSPTPLSVWRSIPALTCKGQPHPTRGCNAKKRQGKVPASAGAMQALGMVNASLHCNCKLWCCCDVHLSVCVCACVCVCVCVCVCTLFCK